MIVDGIVVSPSVASADQLELGMAVKTAEERGCSDIHIDIEDGNFVPNITFGIKTVRALRRATDLPFSFHFMTEQWERWLEYAAECRGSIAFAHAETLGYPKLFVERAHSLGLKAGLAFNPRTSTEDFLYLASSLDGILLLSVEPDEAGEKFIPYTLERVSSARKQYPDAEIWVDGSVNFEMMKELRERGATHAVLGRAFFK